MKVKLLAIALSMFCFLTTIQLQAQRNCATMENLENLIEKNPAIQFNMDEIERFTREYLENKPELQTRNIIEIPTVVHVVWKTNAQNVSDEQIASQILVLNQDFGADTDFTFCLATVDPDGNSTTGIQRRKTNKPSFGTNDNMKFQNKGGINAWPASDYLNIWVCNISGGILGYAQFPGGPAATDGVVIDYAYFGTIGTATAPFHLGRTGTHEVGHWLNLRHIWGDGGCSVDDFVSDTPLSDGPNYGCPNGHVSCGSVDMIENYMDYTDDACMDIFTGGQNDRMCALFDEGGARNSLINSPGCGNGGGNDPTCNDDIQNGDEDGVDCGGSFCEPCETGSCDVPTALNASNIKNKNAKVNFTTVAGATGYTVQYRPSGGGNWSTKSGTGSPITVSGLSNNTNYEWQVRSDCGGSSSTYSNSCYFTTGNSSTGDCGADAARLQKDLLTAFPNPATDLLNIQWTDLDGESNQVEIFSAFGQKVMNERVGFGSGQLSINVRNWAPGLYIIRLTGQDQEMVKRVLVQ